MKYPHYRGYFCFKFFSIFPALIIGPMLIFLYTAWDLQFYR